MGIATVIETAILVMVSNSGSAQAVRTAAENWEIDGFRLSLIYTPRAPTPWSIDSSRRLGLSPCTKFWTSGFWRLDVCGESKPPLVDQKLARISRTSFDSLVSGINVSSLYPQGFPMSHDQGDRIRMSFWLARFRGPQGSSSFSSIKL